MAKKYRNFGAYGLLFFFIAVFITSLVFKSTSKIDAGLAAGVKKLETGIERLEWDIAELVKDSALLARLGTANETRADVEYLYEKPYFFYAYQKADAGQYITFWNTSVAIIPDSILLSTIDEHLGRHP